jgi:hypothetical protein
MNSAFSGFSQLVTLVVGIGALVLAMASWRGDSEMLAKASDSLHWPVASATIRSVAIEKQERHSRSGTYYEYKCNLTYEYKVGAKRFAGTRISYATAGDHFVRDESVVNTVADNFRLNSKHAVRYNPSNHGDSVLIPGVDPDNVSLTSYLSAFIGVMFLCLAAVRATSDGSPSNSSIVLIPMFIVGALCYFMQPAFVRSIVPPSAVIAPIK